MTQIHAAVGPDAQQVAVGQHIRQTLILGAAMPEPTRTLLAMIAATLADLYPTAADRRRLVAWAELDARYIAFDDTPINAWHVIVLHALRQQRLALLVQLALEEYPLDEYLIAYHATLQKEPPDGE